jgi:hypothetical protein
MSMTTAYSVIVQAVDDSSLMFFQQLLLPAAVLQGITLYSTAVGDFLEVMMMMWATDNYHS